MEKPYCNPEIWGGIECTINRVNHQYFDQLNYSGHYSRETDIAQIAELGISKIRYPILWEKHQPAKDTAIDWSWTAGQLESLRSRNIDVIAGLVHHGSGPAFTQLNDRRFPELLAAYAGTVAQRFPWIEYYTPVNEPLTTARFSGLYGFWYPHHKNAKSFMQMLLNELKAVALSMIEIRKVNPKAKLVQTEDLGKVYSTQKLAYQARFENARRWLTYDILCGRFNEQHQLWKYFTQFAIPKEDFYFFLDHPCIPDIFGFNHYLTSERFLDDKFYLYPDHLQGGNGRHRYADVEAVRVPLKEPSGIEALLREAWQRYHQPMAVTEVHLHCHREEQLRWFKQVWEASKKLRGEQVDVRAITSWALLGSYGWNRLLTQPGGDYEPGAFDLRNGKPRKTALAKYIQKIAHTSEDTHHLSGDEGWWKRSTRLIYGPAPAAVLLNRNQAPLLIIGRNGTLGRAFAKLCEERFINYRLLGRADCDISDPASVDRALQQYRPWAIVNAAGYVRVDDAEREPGPCFRDNATGAQNLAAACSRLGIQLLSFSSDLVFDGRKKTPYVEEDPTNPLNVYGRSKQALEQSVLQQLPSALVVRTSAFFSPWDAYNFMAQLRRSLTRYETFTVARDQVVSPTYVPHLVHACLDILIDGEQGIWHLANKGAVSWADLAQDIAARFHLDRSLICTVDTLDMELAAARPAYSVLGTTRGHLLPTLESALDEYTAREKTERRKVA